MSSLDLPVTQDGSGYEKGAVEEYVKQSNYRARHLIEQAETLLSDAIVKKDSIIAEGEDASRVLRGDAQAYFDARKVEADELLAEIQRRKDGLDAEIDGLKAQRLGEIADDLEREKAKANGIVKNAEQKATKLLSEAKSKANAYIEENRSRVHGIVKHAESKRAEAERQAKELHVKSTRAYSDSVAGAGKLTVEAKEILESARIESETLLTYASEESKSLKSEAEAEATRVLAEAHKRADEITVEREVQAQQMIADAQKYSEDVALWASEEIEKSVSIINHYKAFYDDNISRLLALFSTNIEMVSALGNVQFPDGSHNFKTIDTVSDADTDLARTGNSDNKDDSADSDGLSDELLGDLDSMLSDTSFDGVVFEDSTIDETGDDSEKKGK